MPEFDVVVLGTGAAGLVAAIAAHEGGARVGVFEKSERIGGTSAWSGGQIWIPGNPQQRAYGKADSREDALTYLAALSHGLIPEELAVAFVDNGPRVLAFLEEQSPLRFTCVSDYPDYHPELPGGKPEGGRTLECPPFSYAALGEWADRVEVSPYFADIRIAVGETTLGQAVPKVIPEEEKQRRVANDERGLGHALIGGLLAACLDRGIRPQTGHRGVELIMSDGRIAGVRIEGPDGGQIVEAPNVVIATGGFEQDAELVTAFLRGPMTHSVSVPTNTGDGLKMCMRIGAMLGNMREAWWTPVVEVPREMVSTGVQLMSAQRGLPGTIIVNRQGRRFMNEAANYNAAGAAFQEQDTASSSYRNLPCWLIFDDVFRRRHGFGGGLSAVDGKGLSADGWIETGATLGDLARKLGIDADGLHDTVARFNGYAREGHDPDFRRGESAHDRWWGDPRYKGSKRATLGEIGEGPYHAVELKSGSLGTKGGPRTDAVARVKNVDGEVIEGLYAAGNAMASVFGMTYGGAGGTLGPAIVFGFLAGQHAAARRNVGGVA